MSHPVTHIAKIPEIVVPGKRLGRNIEHDPASRAFAAKSDVTLHTQLWDRRCPPFDQGDLGSCTGNAMTGLLMTSPFYRPGMALTEDDAIDLYARATHLDRIPGMYPPDDTGSSGLAVARAAKHAGFIRAYHHAFTMNAALAALMAGPVITGVNWYEGFDTPKGSYAIVEIEGQVRGGHEFEVLGVDIEQRLIRCCNSWGTSWGDGGYFCMSWDTWEQLLHEQGDCTVALL